MSYGIEKFEEAMEATDFILSIDDKNSENFTNMARTQINLEI